MSAALEKLTEKLKALDKDFTLEQLSRMQWLCKATFNNEQITVNELSPERAIDSVLKKIHAKQNP